MSVSVFLFLLVFAFEDAVGCLFCVVALFNL